MLQLRQRASPKHRTSVHGNLLGHVELRRLEPVDIFVRRSQVAQNFHQSNFYGVSSGDWFVLDNELRVHVGHEFGTDDRVKSCGDKFMGNG